MTESRGKQSTLVAFLVLGLIAMAIAAMPGPSAAGEPLERVTICHVTGTGEVTVEVSANSWPAHEAHGDVPYECGRLVITCDNPPPDDPIASFELNAGESFTFTLDVIHEDYCRVLYQSTGSVNINGVDFPGSPGGFTLDPREYTVGVYDITVTSPEDNNTISIKLND